MKTNSFSIITLRGIIGLIQGLSLYGLYLSIQEPIHWWTTHPSLFMQTLMVTLLIPLLIVHGIGNMRGKTLLIWIVSATAIISSLVYYAIFRENLPSEHLAAVTALPALMFFTIIALFIAQPLILSSDHDKRVFAHYPTYFDNAWKLTVQLACTAAFTGFFWLLLWLGASLFNIIHFNFFEKLITKSWFAIPVTTLVITTALHITDVNAEIVRGIRTLILVLLSWLLPLLAGIISVFLISLLFTDLTLLWNTGHASVLLVTTASILIALINATYQDGSQSISLRLLQRYSATLASCLLIPIMALAIYALYLRVHQYGWAVHRIEAAAFMMIIAFYAIGYMLAVFISQSWLKLIERWNVAAAILILVTYLALFTPIADPARLMVADQLSRLQSGQVAPNKFDFQALRRDGARYGRQALLDLQNWKGAEANYVHAQAKEMLLKTKMNVENIKSKPLSIEEKNNLFITHTPDGKLPITFLQQDWNSFKNDFSFYFSCLNPESKSRQRCQAWVIKTNGKSPLILILGRERFTGFQQDDKGIWKIIGNWDVSNAPYNCREKIRDAAQNGKFKMVAPIPNPQPDIEIIGWRARFEQKEKSDTCPSH